MKAQQINPKNGRPYNQLALLAHYAVCNDQYNKINSLLNKIDLFNRCKFIFSGEN